MASAQVRLLLLAYSLIANPGEPEALPDRPDRQASNSKDEVGQCHGVQGHPDRLRWLHELAIVQH